MLMYVRRGVLHPSALRPVVTFGAPAVFCEGGAGACPCDPLGSQAAAATAPGSACGSGSAARQPGGLLAALGLPERAVRNVLMARDIVPRAFACDYSLVADLLKRVSDSFREHRCLNGTRTVRRCLPAAVLADALLEAGLGLGLRCVFLSSPSGRLQLRCPTTATPCAALLTPPTPPPHPPPPQLMFDFIGQVWVLQPEEEATYVAGEGYHPLLPPGPGLYLVREPTPLTAAAGKPPAASPAARGWRVGRGPCAQQQRGSMCAWHAAGAGTSTARL
jgi:hypothetical protein